MTKEKNENIPKCNFNNSKKDIENAIVNRLMANPKKYGLYLHES